MKSKALVLVVSLLIFSIDLPSKERRGAELVVTKNDGQVLKGELIAVKQNSLLLLGPEGADVSVDIKDISIIEILRKSQVLKWAGIGLLGGAGIGAFIGAVAPREPHEFDFWTRGQAIIYCTIVLGVSGFLIGMLAGVAAGTDKEIKIKGKSDAETKKILEKLRRQARVPNAQ